MTKLIVAFRYFEKAPKTQIFKFAYVRSTENDKKLDEDFLGFPADNTACRLPAHISCDKQLDL